MQSKIFYNHKQITKVSAIKKDGWGDKDQVQPLN